MPINRRNLNGSIGKNVTGSVPVSPSLTVSNFYDTPALPSPSNSDIIQNADRLNRGIVKRNRGIGPNSFTADFDGATISPSSSGPHSYTLSAISQSTHQEDTKIVRLSNRPNGNQPIPLPEDIKSVVKKAFFFSIGGGGGGGKNNGGGGGAGAAFVGSSPIPNSAIPIILTVGSGGPGSPSPSPPSFFGGTGGPSSVNINGIQYTSGGGGGGAGDNNSGLPGGCGGGCSKPGTSPRPSNMSGGANGAGNEFPTPVTSFGNNGGSAEPFANPGCGGGGGISGGGSENGNGGAGRFIFGINMGGGGAGGEGTMTAGVGGGPSGGGSGSNGLGAGGGAGGPSPTTNGGSGGNGRAGYFIEYFTT